MPNPIFRRSSFERLSSPDQLDQLVPVTTAKGWIALAGLAALLGGVVFWGVFGSVPSKVTASGIIVGQRGIHAVRSRGAGQVGSVMLKVGDTVSVGDLAARIEQPSALEQIANDEKQLAQLQERQRKIADFHATDLGMKLQNLDAERSADERSIALLNQRLALLGDKLKAQQSLVDRGIISNETVIETTENIRVAREELGQKTDHRDQISVEALNLRNAKDRELLDNQLQIDDLARRIEKSKADLDLASQVLSPYAGRVTEVHAGPGTFVEEGATVALVETGPAQAGDDTLEAVIYAPADQGKKVRPGMVAQVSPTTAKLEEYGFIPGHVTFVSQFPVTADAMMRLVENKEFVDSITRQGSPVEIHVSLATDASTPSGFAWSSSVGPAARVSQGTICATSFVTESRRPVDLVIPYLKEKLGL